MHILDEPAVVALCIVSVGEHIFASAVFKALSTTDLCLHWVPSRLGVSLSSSVVCTCDLISSTNLVLAALSLLLKHPL